MYLVVSDHAVSSVLLRQQEGVQRLVFYLSKMLVDAETRYLPLEKISLALVHATRKLPHYFQAYTVQVLTEHCLQSLLRRSNFTGRIAKQGTRLGTFDIRYNPRNSIKGQVLAKFMAEFTPSQGAFVGICRVWVKCQKVYVDSASNARGSGVGIVMVSPKGLRMEKLLRLGFHGLNNEAEYEALLAGLWAVQKLGAEEVEVLQYYANIREL